MNSKISLLALPASLLVVAGISMVSGSHAQGDQSLRPVGSFNSIENEEERSLALFEEAGKVIQHPRCVNCHPASDRPLQGDAMRLHEPPVFRGDGGIGLPGMQCISCHSTENITVVSQSETIRSIPGHPSWHLAPIEMAWEGKSLGQICRQIKDPNLNGDMTMDELVEHMAHDELVGWGWAPGTGREPAPGTQESFGALIRAWVETGAICPTN